MFQSQKYLLKTFFVNSKPLPTEYTEFNFFLFFEVAAHFSLSCNCHEKMENLLWDMNFIVV